MAKRTQYALIYSIGVLIYFMLQSTTYDNMRIIPLLIVTGAGFYYNNKLKIRKNGRIYLFLLMILFLLAIILNNGNYFSSNETIFGIIVSFISFIFLNYLVFE